MAQVITAIITRELCFRDRRGEPERLYSSKSRQRVSETVAVHPYFLAAIASNWVQDVQVIDSLTGDLSTFDDYRAKRRQAARHPNSKR